MNNQFAYCFFRYIHSLRLGESLNVGLLLLFPSSNIIQFKYPKDLQRIKCTYNDFEEDQLRAYLKAFESKAENLSNSFVFTDQDELNNEYLISIIKKEFLLEDEGALQFSEVKKAVLYTENIDQISEDIYFSYFQHYYDKEQVNIRASSAELFRRDENYILKKIQDLIVREQPALKSFQFDGREIKTQNALLKFDFEWNNHGLHLVKPLSLDYRNSNSIEEKAHSLHSKLHMLELETAPNTYQFDILVSKPQLSKLQSTYQKAVSILRESTNKTNVIEEDTFSSYSKQAAEALSS